MGRPDYAAPVSPRRSRKGLWATLVAIVVVLAISGAVAAVLIVNHRADVAAQERRDEAARERAEEERLAAEAEAERAAEEAAEQVRVQGIYDNCVSQLGPLLNALNIVDARLDVGLSQQELSDLVGKVSVAYSKMDVPSLGKDDCLTAGANLESAFNQYVTTVSDWNDCIFDYGCDTDDIEPAMQAKWTAASNHIDKARRAMERLNPSSPTFNGPGSAA